VGEKIKFQALMALKNEMEEEILLNEIIATAFLMSEVTFILHNNCIC